MMYIHLKKIHEKLSNSLVFLATICIMLGFVCATIVLVQIPDYANMVRAKIAEREAKELTESLEQLQENYYDNSREFYDAYINSPFYDWGKSLDKPVYEYTDDDIRFYTMNQYFAKYLKEDLISNQQDDFSTEVSTFIRIYKDTLLENEDLEKVMSDRKILQDAIGEVVTKLKAVSAHSQK